MAHLNRINTKSLFNIIIFDYLQVKGMSTDFVAN